MLTTTQFQQWCRGLDLSKDACEVIARVRSSPPARRVGGRAHNVSGAYASRKMRCTIQFESHTVELWAIYAMEYAQEVLEYYDQPMVLELRYKSAKGKPVRVEHTPDFLVLRKDGACFEEWKPEERLAELAEKQPQRYQCDSQGNWRCPPGEATAALLGLSYRVRSSSELPPIYIRNLIFLEDYFFEHVVETELEERILSQVHAQPGISLDALVSDEAHLPVDAVHTLIARNQLYVDLAAAPLIVPNLVFLYPDQPTSDAYALLRRLPPRELPSVPGHAQASVRLKPHTTILWDGRLFQVVNVGQTNVYLRSEEGPLTELSLDVFQQFVATSTISIPQPPVKDELSRLPLEAQRLLREASPDHLAIATRRARLLEAYRKRQRDQYEGVPTRTLREWAARFEIAQATYQWGYLGLLPQTAKRGNRKLRSDPASRELLDTFIETYFEQPEQPPARTVYWAYHHACLERGLPILSERTFYRRVNSRRGMVQTARRKGRRAAYQDSPWYPVLQRSTPRHGDRPWEIVHLDHTPLDVELVTETGRLLGTPTVTFAVDAYSRRILALFLSFDRASYRSCMMVLRACVQRHERFPQHIVVDRGPEFQSVYFEHLLAYCGCHKKERPASSPRFGSVIERLFGTTNTQFVHTLRGNTQARTPGRQMTREIDPKRRAVWPLPYLYERLTEWAYDIYDQQFHETLGQSPRDAYLTGLELFGERAHRRVFYNEAFLMETRPDIPRKTSLVVQGRGVKVHYLYYWNDAFRHPEVVRTRVPVRYDPFDVGTVYAYTRGEWVPCISQFYSAFHGHSEKELMLAAETLREQARLNHKQASLTPLRLANFLAEVHEHERVLLQRLRDLEVKAVRETLSGKTAGRPADMDPRLDSSLDEGVMIDLETIPVFEEYR